MRKIALIAALLAVLGIGAVVTAQTVGQGYACCQRCDRT